MQKLIYEAYVKYGSLTTGEIERMRLKHRLKVVQELEDNSERNTIRSVIIDGYFTQQELQVSLFNHRFHLVLKLPFQELLGIVREEILSQKRQVPEKNDPTLQPYETYKVDYDYFKLLFGAFSPWGKGATAESLSARIFRVQKPQNFIVMPNCTLFFLSLAHGPKSRRLLELPRTGCGNWTNLHCRSCAKT